MTGRLVPALCVALLLLGGGPSLAQPPASADASSPVAAPLTREARERFLLEAPVVKVRGGQKGITGTQRATLSDGTVTHDVSIQTIDESVARFESMRRVEFNFRDYWGYNVAAYRLSVMLGLDMVPPSVARIFRGSRASYTWWIDDVVMDEQERSKRKLKPPHVLYWNTQNYVVKVFDELIANTDRNQGNLLIDSRWKLWMIDHSRAFRMTHELANPAKLLHCERKLFAGLKTLTEDALKAELGEYLTSFEIEAILKRRDLIVKRIEALGPNALYDLRPPAS